MHGTLASSRGASASCPRSKSTSRYKLHTVHLYTVHCTLYTAHCTLYTVHCTLHTVHCTLDAQRSRNAQPFSLPSTHYVTLTGPVAVSEGRGGVLRANQRTMHAPSKAVADAIGDPFHAFRRFRRFRRAPHPWLKHDCKLGGAHAGPHRARTGTLGIPGPPSQRHHVANGLSKLGEPSGHGPGRAHRSVSAQCVRKSLLSTTLSFGITNH